MSDQHNTQPQPDKVVERVSHYIKTFYGRWKDDPELFYRAHGRVMHREERIGDRLPEMRPDSWHAMRQVIDMAVDHESSIYGIAVEVELIAYFGGEDPSFQVRGHEPKSLSARMLFGADRSSEISDSDFEAHLHNIERIVTIEGLPDGVSAKEAVDEIVRVASALEEQSLTKCLDLALDQWIKFSSTSAS